MGLPETCSACAVCGGQFHADYRSGAAQKVCSAECRRARRREQARQRRADDPDGFRKADRVRQQEWRARHRTGQNAPPTPMSPCVTAPVEPVSRAGFASEAGGTMAEILLAWDRAARVSRVVLARDLSKILGKRADYRANGEVNAGA